MKFEEVLPLLREGKKARYPGCVVEGSYYFIRDRRLFYADGNGEAGLTTMSGCEIVDAEWEIVD